MTKQLTAQQIAEQAEAMVCPELSQILLLTADLKLTLAYRKVLAVKCLDRAAKWSQEQKARLAGISRKTWYRAERDPEFNRIATDFTKSQVGKDVPEIWAKYNEGAKSGGRPAQAERILQQIGILDKPQPVKAGDTNISLAVTVEQKQELERKRITNQRAGLESLGYTLHTDN